MRAMGRFEARYRFVGASENRGQRQKEKAMKHFEFDNVLKIQARRASE